MAINTNKVLLGGIAAGVVLNVIDFATNTFILGARMKAETEAFKPGLSDRMMTGSAITSYIIMDLVLGILLVLTYAAIRPRFGPGVRRCRGFRGRGRSRRGRARSRGFGRRPSEPTCRAVHLGRRQ